MTFHGYHGRCAWIDLTNRQVRIEPADSRVYREYVGGRGVQAHLVADRLLESGPLFDPLSPESRVVLGSAALNDTAIPTAGRGSCTFVSPMTRAPHAVPGVPPHPPVHGLLTHASAGGLFPNMLKRAGLDHLIIEGRADRPVRLLVTEAGVAILDAEDELFEERQGERVTRTASAITNLLTRKHPGASTVCLGPAGWNQVAFACLTADHHRNFGRGGAGAVFGSKNLVAVTAYGRRRVRPADFGTFDRLARELEALVGRHASDPARTASFRPATGTTWWLDRAFDGGYLGRAGGYLPWHNFDEGHFDPAAYAGVGTRAFLGIAGRHHVCNRCRHIMCTRAARVESGPFAGEGVRPEFETIALGINCCLVDRDAIFHANRVCNDLGLDTMTFGSVVAGAMELAERGLLSGYSFEPAFGSATDLIRTLESIAYQTDDVGRLLGGPGDRTIATLARRPGADADVIASAVTLAFGALGYAGIEPKVFPGMFAAYATSNRGRGDHTYAWTIQAEEAGLIDATQIAAYVASSQAAKALVDSLGLCDFFPEDVLAEPFLACYRALSGIDYSPEELETCGRRIYALERLVNAGQGRTRDYDAYVPPKMTVPLTCGPHQGNAVDPAFHNAVLDAYYAVQGWSADGRVPPSRLAELDIAAKGVGSDSSFCNAPGFPQDRRT